MQSDVDSRLFRPRKTGQQRVSGWRLAGATSSEPIKSKMTSVMIDGVGSVDAIETSEYGRKRQRCESGVWLDCRRPIALS